jgi:hypothetical protein
MGTIAKFLFVLQDTHNMGISPSGSAGNEALSRNIHGTFKQTWFALFVKTTLSLRYGGVDVTRRIRVPACQMILAVLDQALHADNT